MEAGKKKLSWQYPVAIAANNFTSGSGARLALDKCPCYNRWVLYYREESG